MDPGEPPGRVAPGRLAGVIAVFLAASFAPAYALDYTLAIPLLESGEATRLLAVLLARMALPALAALAALRLVEGVPPARALGLLGLGRGSLRISWGLAGAGLALAGYTASLPVAALAGLRLGPCGPLAGLERHAGGALLYAVIAAALAAGVLAGATVNALAALGEELGWRGLLYPRLSMVMPRWAAALATGVVWGLWHAPLVAAGYDYSIEPLRGCGAPSGGLAAVAVFTATTASMGLLLALLRDASGGVYAPAAAHGTVNAVAGLYASLVAGPRLAAPPGGLSVAAGFAAVALAAYAMAGGGLGGLGEAGEGG